MAQQAKEVFQRKTYIETMAIRELTKICKLLELKSYGKMPNMKYHFIEVYIVWKNRPPPVFEDKSSTLFDG